LNIRPAKADERDIVRDIARRAFGSGKGAVIADLVAALLDDPTAAPVLSLLAVENDRALGHILFSRVTLAGVDESPSAAILAPLAIVPDAQGQGIGGRLIRDGLRRLAVVGVELVFVLGHPAYYPRHGFQPAGIRGFTAPYPIAEEHAEAWMVQELRSGVIGTVKGTVTCAEALDRPEHWRE
jgi:predicted N-acetyltransferase YhbS